jgi:hypothetical protein
MAWLVQNLKSTHMSSTSDLLASVSRKVEMKVKLNLRPQSISSSSWTAKATR